MKKYLNGTILETLERIKSLKSKIPSKELPECFHQLAALCSNDIDITIKYLKDLINNPKFEVQLNQSRKLINFKKFVEYIDYLENKIIAALHRWNPEDVNFTKLVQKICKEINYPLLPPVASRLSQEYYCIDTKFNHLRVPLLESEFLLHMPDLYHELAHPIIAMTNDPRVKKYQIILGKFISFAQKYCQDEITTYKRNGCKDEARSLEVYNQSWVNWAIEFFCDLYATYSLGPAYAWANLHLCIKRGSNPFHTPSFVPNSHPADNARMEVILYGVNLIGFKQEKINISKYWNEYIAISGSSLNSYYKIAFPKHLLEHCAMSALDAANAINCQIAKPELQNEVYLLLNTAWKKFIDNPSEYIKWERQQREEYKV